MPAELKKDTVATIKKQSVSITLRRTDIIAADQTYDGIQFQLKHGLIISYTDGFMPNEAKMLIANSVNSFPNANLTIDLDNYRKPVVANIVQ